MSVHYTELYHMSNKLPILIKPAGEHDDWTSDIYPQLDKHNEAHKALLDMGDHLISSH